MEQYEKSGPPQENKPNTDKDHMLQVKDQMAEQASRIDFLEREVRRLKSRLDDTVAAINKRNG
jgi:polyhydroxyalkanoate synthesis regulator phasin